MKRKRSSEKQVRVDSSESVDDSSQEDDEDFDPAEYCKIRVILTTCIEVDRDSTIEEIKQKFQEISGTPPEERLVIHNARRLDPTKTLADYDIKNNDKVWLTNDLK